MQAAIMKSGDTGHKRMNVNRTKPEMGIAKISPAPDYREAAKVSRGQKLKAMGFDGGGPVTAATFPIRPAVVPSLPTGKKS